MCLCEYLCARLFVSCLFVSLFNTYVFDGFDARSICDVIACLFDCLVARLFVWCACLVVCAIV